MNSRSKALQTFLSNAGVLHGTSEEILRCKKAYRAHYKRNWKKARVKQKEIRIQCNTRLYECIKARAKQYNETPTACVRNIITASIEGTLHIPQRDTLLRVLQLISMAATTLMKPNIPMTQIRTQVDDAEAILLQYLT